MRENFTVLWPCARAAAPVLECAALSLAAVLAPSGKGPQLSRYRGDRAVPRETMVPTSHRAGRVLASRHRVGDVGEGILAWPGREYHIILASQAQEQETLAAYHIILLPQQLWTRPDSQRGFGSRPLTPLILLRR